MSPLREGEGRDAGRVPYPTSFGLRSVSLLLAIALSALVFIYPRVIAGTAAEVRHGALALLLWGVAAGFVHGVGFVPRSGFWRVVFHPVLGWLLMIGGIIWLAGGR